jgi:hypothetical protein
LNRIDVIPTWHRGYIDCRRERGRVQAERGGRWECGLPSHLDAIDERHPVGEPLDDQRRIDYEAIDRPIDDSDVKSVFGRRGSLQIRASSGRGGSG